MMEELKGQNSVEFSQALLEWSDYDSLTHFPNKDKDEMMDKALSHVLVDVEKVFYFLFFLNFFNTFYFRNIMNTMTNTFPLGQLSQS